MAWGLLEALVESNPTGSHQRSGRRQRSRKLREDQAFASERVHVAAASSSVSLSTQLAIVHTLQGLSAGKEHTCILDVGINDHILSCDVSRTATSAVKASLGNEMSVARCQKTRLQMAVELIDFVTILLTAVAVSRPR